MENMEFGSKQAKHLINEEVLEYRKALIQLASIIAKREIKPDVITSSHIIDARRRLWKKPTKFSFYDSVFAVGCAFLGVTIKSIVERYITRLAPLILL